MKCASDQDVVVVGNDTDILVMLLNKYDKSKKNVYFKSEPISGMKKEFKIWDIRTAQNRLPDSVIKHLLFVHAILGCDTTSHPFGIGKQVALNKMKNDKFVKCAEVFFDKESTIDQVIEAGETAYLVIYNGDKSIDELRLRKYREKVVTNSTHVEPKQLPPTSAALHHHSMRVYHQVQSWLGNEMDPLKWGWVVENNTMLPVMTLKEAAPAKILNLIRCGCKSGCNSKRCSCRKNGLQCTTACVNCHGVCTNSNELPDDNHDDADVGAN